MSRYLQTYQCRSELEVEFSRYDTQFQIVSRSGFYRKARNNPQFGTEGALPSDTIKQ